jgi:hypothetical protein
MDKRIAALVFVLLVFNAVTQPLNGTYTIGGASPNFNNLSEAAVALNTNGVSGPVVMNISPGVYLEQITLNAISGASTLNRIIFRSTELDSTSVTISFNSGSSNNYLIQLNNSDYITIQSINFQPLNSTYKTAIYAYNGCSDINVTNNLFSGGGIYVYNVGSPSFNNLFSFNRFSGGAGLDQIKTISPSNNKSNGTIIENNIFEGTATRSINLSFEDNLSVRKNYMNGSRTNNTVIFSNCGPSLTLEQNQIIMTSSNVVSLNNCSGTELSHILIRNNMIKGSNTCLSINYSNYISLLNNTLQSAAGVNGSTLYFASNNSNIDVFNNILSTSMGGSPMTFSQAALISTTNSDYNNLYTSSANKVKVGSTGMTMTTWNTNYGKDLNSILTEPVFVSDTDLHIDNCTPLNGSGTPIAIVTVDIDDQSRDALVPDIGADEFEIDLSTFQDIAISVISPDTTNCVFEDQLIVAVVNKSIFPITSFQISYWLFDQLMYSETVSASLQPNDTISVSLGTFDFNYNTGYNLRFEASQPNNTFDDYPFDNSYAFTYYLLNTLTIYSKPISDCSTEHKLSVLSFPCESILWSTGETTRSIITTAPGTYSVIVTTSGGCTYTDSIILN